MISDVSFHFHARIEVLYCFTLQVESAVSSEVLHVCISAPSGTAADCRGLHVERTRCPQCRSHKTHWVAGCETDEGKKTESEEGNIVLVPFSLLLFQIQICSNDMTIVKLSYFTIHQLYLYTIVYCNDREMNLLTKIKNKRIYDEHEI